LDPTFVVNNQIKTRAVHAEAIKKALCNKNPKLAGCQATLSARLVK